MISEFEKKTQTVIKNIYSLNLGIAKEIIIYGINYEKVLKPNDTDDTNIKRSSAEYS